MAGKRRPVVSDERGLLLELRRLVGPAGRAVRREGDIPEGDDSDRSELRGRPFDRRGPAGRLRRRGLKDCDKPSPPHPECRHRVWNPLRAPDRDRVCAVPVREAVRRKLDRATERGHLQGHAGSRVLAGAGGISSLCIVKTAPPTKSRTYAPLEFRAEDGETPPLCSTLLSSSSHLASVPFGRCVGAAPTWCWRTSLCGSK